MPTDVLLRPADDLFRGETTDHPAGDVVVEQVSFGYGTFGRRVLDGACLRVPEGAKVAIVGPSGCGKSTLARLLVGLHRPDSGRILIGGVELGGHDRDRFYEAVAYVPQNVVLEYGTVRDNIAWGAGDLPSLMLGVALLVGWVRTDRSETKRLDRQADRADDAELKAYNARLAALTPERPTEP